MLLESGSNYYEFLFPFLPFKLIRFLGFLDLHFSQVTIMEMTFAYAVAFNQVPTTLLTYSTSQPLKALPGLRFLEIRSTVVYRSISGDIHFPLTSIQPFSSLILTIFMISSSFTPLRSL